MSDEQLTTIYTHHTAQLQRIGAAEGRKVLPYLQTIESGVDDILNKYRRRNVSIELQLRIEEEISKLTREQLQLYTVELKAQNRELGEYEGVFAAQTIGDVTSDAAVALTPTAAEVNRRATITPINLGGGSFTSYKSLMRNYWTKYSDEIDGIIKAGFRDGTSIREISQDIMSRMELSKSGTTGNTLDKARRAARQLAITGNNHYANTARLEFVNKNDKLLKGYRFLAVQDSKTSSPCRSLDQQVFVIDYKKLSTVTPPLHPHCRSALSYEVDDKFKIDKDGTKASSFTVDGKRDPKPISSDGIYYHNLSKLSAADQNSVLGSTLGRAMRKLNNPKQFASLLLDNENTPFTMTQLKQQNNALGRILRAQQKS